MTEGPCLSDPLVRSADVRRLLTLGASGDVEADALAFGQGLETRTLDRGEVGEEVVTTVFGCDEAEALGVIEPLNSTVCHVLYILKKQKKGLAPDWDEGQDGGGMKEVYRRTAPNDCPKGLR